MKILIDITEDTYNSVCNESMLPQNVKNVIDGIKNGQLLTDNATNGDIVKTMFPEYEETRMYGAVRYGSKEYANLEFVVDEDWWDSPYRG